MHLPVAAIRQYAKDVGIGEGFFMQHQELLESFALRVSLAQRKKDKLALRAWYFDKTQNKPQLFEVLDED